MRGGGLVEEEDRRVGEMGQEGRSFTTAAHDVPRARRPRAGGVYPVRPAQWEGFPLPYCGRLDQRHPWAAAHAKVKVEKGLQGLQEVAWGRLLGGTDTTQKKGARVGHGTNWRPEGGEGRARGAHLSSSSHRGRAAGTHTGADAGAPRAQTSKRNEETWAPRRINEIS